MDLQRISALFEQRREGHTLPQALYTESDSFDFDMAAIYGQSWLMAGMECELPKTGSYISMMVGKWPVVITRDKEGTIRAFHNSCRHRGSMVCQPGHGTAPKLVCPYHRWTYDLDGSLFAAGRMEDDFDKSAHGLKPIAIECFGGAIFICLADNPPSIDDFREKFSAYAAPANFENLKLAHVDKLVEDANWKLVMENARECYHCATGHPELAKTFPVGMSKHFDAHEDARAEAFSAAMDAHGFPHEPVEGHWWQVARFALNEGCTSMSEDGKPLIKKPLISANGGDIGSLRWAIDPHLFAHATSDYVFMFSCMPVSATETHVFSKWYVHKDAVEGVDYDVDALISLWAVTNSQDKELAENNHKGVNSPGYTPGPYSADAEMLARRFTDWYCDVSRVYIDSHGK